MRHVFTAWFNPNSWAVFFEERRGFHVRYFVKTNRCAEFVPTTKYILSKARKAAKS